MKMKRIVAVLLCLVMVFSFSACNSGGDVLATVDGQKIYQKDVEGLSALLALMSSMNYEELDEGTKAQINNSMLIFFIDVQAMKSHFEKEKKTVVTEEDEKSIDEQADTMLNSLKEQGSSVDVEKLHITKELLVSYLTAEKYDTAYRAEIAEKNPVTDKEIKAYYEKNKAQYTREVEERQVSHILIGDETHSDADRAAAEEIRAKVLAGEDFATLATENSKDTGSAANGGDVGAVKQDGSMVKPFEDAVFALAEEGAISELVESDYGFHIIKLVAILPPGEKPLDDVKDEIKSTLEQEKVTEEYPKLRKEVKIEYAKSIEVDKETNLPIAKQVETGSADK
ncbi:MAG: peptidylprolyl isomerase [Clostridiales Family XIII bacterium]|jgi:parvulin-like peptidyl-prolyl isomerase|nr:peptidylprolyl isomerase [Clostridiales Family XIII bacterium]